MKKLSLLILSVAALALTACGTTTPKETVTVKAIEAEADCSEVATSDSITCQSSCDKECDKGEACCKKTGKACDTPCSGDKSCAEKKGDCKK